jgi:hypothetical protein
MIEQMAAKHQHMQHHHAEASSYRQSTMTQEFNSIADQAETDALPPGWRQQWDSNGNRPYYLNTIDYDIQLDVSKVHERAALSAFVEKENKPEQYANLVCPNGVLSGKNNTISPSPVTNRNTKRYFECKQAPSVMTPTTNGGLVDMTNSAREMTQLIVVLCLRLHI